MKTVTILFAEKNSKYMFDKAFGQESSFEKALNWAKENKSEKTVIFTYDEIKSKITDEISSVCKDVQIVYLPEWKTENLISMAKEVASGADAVIYAWADCPFLNRKITDEIIETHTEFLAEYTYAEGYPYGFSPEMIDSGTLGILKQLAETSQKDAGNVLIHRESFFDFLKTDINAFEIETVLANDDYRLCRFHFDCSKKENFISCKNLFESLDEQNRKDVSKLDADELSHSASKNPLILKTVPGFYSIQLSPKCISKPDYLPSDSPVNKGENMDVQKAVTLIEEIAAFSENAVVGLSYFGDPIYNEGFIEVCKKILSYPGLSVFIETDFMHEEMALELKKISEGIEPSKNGYERIMISICLDGASAGTFSSIRGRKESDFEAVCKNIAFVSELFPLSTYPQLVRVHENENELESFYRYWNEKSNPSKGNFIIQKYNSFCKKLPDRKPADLSPVERNVCWHLRRDMYILSNGDVTFCHCLYGKIIGNVFNQSVSEIWNAHEAELKNHIEKKYCAECGDCDEFYTFNF